MAHGDAYERFVYETWRADLEEIEVKRQANANGRLPQPATPTPVGRPPAAAAR